MDLGQEREPKIRLTDERCGRGRVVCQVWLTQAFSIVEHTEDMDVADPNSNGRERLQAFSIENSRKRAELYGDAKHAKLDCRSAV
jgi:hypothetical protein